MVLGVWFLLWIGEVVADQQQWNFQTKKYKLIGEGKKLEGEYADGFLSSGKTSPRGLADAPRSLPIFPPSELLLRDRVVVDSLRLRDCGYRYR